MAASPPARLLLIRHARSAAAGRLAGRLDVPATLPAAATLAQARGQLACLLPGSCNLFSSPALRCRQTAEALLPDTAITEDSRLWEQHFGAWEGQEAATLPDLGPLRRADLAAHRPPGGETFLEVATRTHAALAEIAPQGPGIIITHAGVIRAAIGLALGDATQGLAFEIAPFSATLLTLLEDAWSIGFVNLALAP
ncbi:MAG: histidine phosphatase family protein [Rhodospirillales bacterium]|nr:histidine phosphatase family protein [Rhodospirillales bacterium]